MSAPYEVGFFAIGSAQLTPETRVGLRTREDRAVANGPPLRRKRNRAYLRFGFIRNSLAASVGVCRAAHTNAVKTAVVEDQLQLV